MATQPQPRLSLREEVLQTSRLATPIILSQVGQMLMGVVDTIVAGRISTDALAGLGLGSIILWHCIMVLLGLLLALDTFFSQSIGARDEKSLQHWFIQSVWLALALSFFAIVILFGANFGYRGIAADTSANQQFSVYLLHAIHSVPAIFLFFVLQRYWQAKRRVVFLALTTLAANSINLAVNLALGLGWWGFPELGTQGIAYATIFSRWAMLGTALIYTARLRPRHLPFLAKPNWSAQKTLLQLGLPAGGQAFAELSVFMIASVLAGLFGAIPLASHHICLTMAAFTYMFSNGVGAAAAVRVGHAVGANQPEKGRRSGNVSLVMSASIMAIFAAAYLVAPRQLAALFTTDPKVIQLTAQLFLIVAVFQIADGLQVTAAGALRGWGNTKDAFRANVIGHLGVGLPISLLTAFVWQWHVIGLWIGLAVGLIVVAWLVVRYWRQGSAPYQITQTPLFILSILFILSTHGP